MEPIQPVPNTVSEASNSRGSMGSASSVSIPHRDRDEEQPNNSQQNKKPNKMSDEMITSVKKRSDADAPRVVAKINSYMMLERKRHRAAEARGRVRMQHRGKKSPGKKPESAENAEHRRDDQRLNGEKRPRSRSPIAEPADRCGRRRRRHRSCRRRSRCRRRRSRCRRRRRSRSRRRRRRSCGRRRRRARRCRR